MTILLVPLTVSDQEPRTRRSVLVGVGVATALAVAGCTDDSENLADGNNDSGSSDDGGDTEETDSGAERDDADDETDSGDDSEESDGENSDEGCPNESVHAEYEETDVRITADDEELGSVTGAIADTTSTRRTGLSDTDCLPEDRGMLFVFEESSEQNFWMNEMDFGLDIIYIDSDGVITSLHHAEAPAEDETGREEIHQYPGEGQYVLEVNLGWTTERGITAGDTVEFDL